MEITCKSRTEAKYPGPSDSVAGVWKQAPPMGYCPWDPGSPARLSVAVGMGQRMGQEQTGEQLHAVSPLLSAATLASPHPSPPFPRSRPNGQR